MKNPANWLIVAAFVLALVLLAWLAPRVPERTIVGSLLGMMICVFFPVLSLLCSLVFAYITWTALEEDDFVLKEIALEPQQLQLDSSPVLQNAEDVMRDIYAQERADLETRLLQDRNKTGGIGVSLLEDLLKVEHKLQKRTDESPPEP